jgi:hypothetical protein
VKKFFHIQGNIYRNLKSLDEARQQSRAVSNFEKLKKLLDKRMKIKIKNWCE